jgi:thiol-disulfide isomerase/thioredoxin
MFSLQKFFTPKTKQTSSKTLKPVNKTRKNIQPNGNASSSKRLIIGKVYAEWCGHCVQMKPEWKKLQVLLKQDKNIKNYKFVSMEEKNLDKKMKIFHKRYNIPEDTKINVLGFPTIFMIKNGVVSYYSGNRNAEEMRKWIQSQNPVVTSPVSK